MKVEKVDIKELWFTEQLLYWNDIKDNRIKELEEENETLYKKLQEIGENNFELKKENKNLKLTIEQMENTCKDYLNDRDTLREENKKLKNKLSEITMVADDEKQSIEHILELEQENKRLSEKNKIYSNALVQEKEENRKLSEWKIIYASEKEQRHYVDMLEENRKLKEYNWELIDNHKKDIDILCEENRKLKLHIEAKDKAYTALLKDYEELKEKNKNLKEKLEKQLWEMLFDVRS